MATPNIQLSAAADTRSPLQKIFSSTNLVLFMVCLMYGLTYIDRINVNTAGPSISHDLHLSTVQRVGCSPHLDGRIWHCKSGEDG